MIMKYVFIILLVTHDQIAKNRIKKSFFSFILVDDNKKLLSTYSIKEKIRLAAKDAPMGQGANMLALGITSFFNM